MRYGIILLVGMMLFGCSQENHRYRQVNTNALVEKSVIFIEAGTSFLRLQPKERGVDYDLDDSFKIDYPAVVIDRGSYIRLKEAEMAALRHGLIE